MPKLSVIVTAYNIEKYIAECLDCVVNQTLKDIEIIAVDDGSTDGTAQILREYAARDKRIRLVLFDKNTIGGVASAANAGLEVATGDYVGFADGDDICDTDMFRQLYQAAVSADADLAMCNYRLLDEGTGAKEDPADIRRWAGIEDQEVWELADNPHGVNRKRLLQFIAVPWRKIYRRSFVESNAIRFPVGDYFYEDNPFHWYSVLSADRVAFVPGVLCQHRVARIGQTMSTVDERLLKIFEHEHTIRTWLKSRNLDEEYAPELLAWVCAQMSWVSLRAEGEMQQKLYQKLSPIVQSYPKEVVDTVTERQPKASRVATMLPALSRNDYIAFARSAGYRLPEKSLIGLGLYHLRHAGVRETAITTVRFLRSRIASRRGGFGGGRNAASSAALQSQMLTRLSDIQFGLVVLQRRIDAMEQQLRQERAERQSGKDDA